MKELIRELSKRETRRSLVIALYATNGVFDYALGLRAIPCYPLLGCVEPSSERRAHCGLDHRESDVLDEPPRKASWIARRGVTLAV